MRRVLAAGLFHRPALHRPGRHADGGHESETLLAGSAELEVGGRRWTLVLNPREPFISAHRGIQAEAILITGILITLLLTAFAYSTFARTAVIEKPAAWWSGRVQLSDEVAEPPPRWRAGRQAGRVQIPPGIFENSIEGIFQTTLRWQVHQRQSRPGTHLRV